MDSPANIEPCVRKATLLIDTTPFRQIFSFSMPSDSSGTMMTRTMTDYPYCVAFCSRIFKQRDTSISDVPGSSAAPRRSSRSRTYQEIT